ncbi:hypothetical protein [Enemella evansiae]|uniref:hypothetical protein n=1 Tax=Enemella evansiae TaxID=2016499 RepID=UPI001414CCDF|nr:hypothetical protein [Enemella evansiae]
MLRQRALEHPQRSLPELRRKLTGHDPSSQTRRNKTQDDSTTGRIEQLIRDALASGQQQLARDQAEAEHAADQAREREKLRRARRNKERRERRRRTTKLAASTERARESKPRTSPPEQQPALIPNQDSKPGEPAPF